MVLFCINLCDSPTDSFINVIIKTDRNVNVKSDNFLSIFVFLIYEYCLIIDKE